MTLALCANTFLNIDLDWVDFYQDPRYCDLHFVKRDYI